MVFLSQLLESVKNLSLSAPSQQKISEKSDDNQRGIKFSCAPRFILCSNLTNTADEVTGNEEGQSSILFPPRRGEQCSQATVIHKVIAGKKEVEVKESR
ncbi:MAG: hypothetical protein ABI977_25105 [Acidobacteriota bacterium]